VSTLDFNAAEIMPARPAPRVYDTLAVAQAFREALLLNLGHAPAFITPGTLQRFSTCDRSGDDAGWCLLFPDGAGGVYGDWRTGREQQWWAESLPGQGPDQTLMRQRLAEARQSVQ
jgi:putative DNA primase/helicase